MSIPSSSSWGRKLSGSSELFTSAPSEFCLVEPCNRSNYQQIIISSLNSEKQGEANFMVKEGHSETVFLTFKHIYHRDLVCENKSNVIIVWLYTAPFIFKHKFLKSLFCLQNMHINEAGNGRPIKWTWVFHPVHMFCRLCEFCELISFARYVILCPSVLAILPYAICDCKLALVSLHFCFCS